MNIITIPLRCLRQKWGRSAALLSVFLLGVAAITALNNVSSSVAEGFEKKLSAFGANIAITPKRETLQISYGGIPLGNATVDSGYIPLAETLRAIEGIPLKDRISVVAPKLAGLVSFAGKTGDVTVLVPLVGVNFESEVELKQFWHVRGSIPGVENMHAPDPLMQRLEEQHAKHADQADMASATNQSSPMNSGKTAQADSMGQTAQDAQTDVAAPAGQSESPVPAASGMQQHQTDGDYSAFFAGINEAQQFLYTPGPIDFSNLSTASEAAGCSGMTGGSTDYAGQSSQAAHQGHEAAGTANLNGNTQHATDPTSMMGIAQHTGQDASHNPQAALHGQTRNSSEGITPGRHLLAGASVAERLNLAPGQTIWLNGGQFLVEGVLQSTGSDDDNVLFAHMAEAQKLFHAPDAASFIEVAALCSGCPIEDIVDELSASLPGQDIRALRQVVAQRMYSISFAQNMALVVTVVILFSACVMVVMSMLVSVNERRKEIGLLRAVGFSRRAVFFVFAAEALVIGFLAGTTGYAAGYFAGSKVLVAMQIEAAAYPAFSFAALFGYGLMASALAVLAAAFPACKAARANPAEALTSL
ncbi:ABC transporter permease [Desulfovibrio intestinalis]|uniref:Putative ABC transport system permease protein n=1 Tax=Desulfovibrio intestinalis TaxID=58621 RepID=A0A7W8C221_9BACT|nr:FtsX-like permease family protein [Desulfovibrio intestinalis]MBB5143428.1 putative ABC transport system permease protein [Desulfovibrio intestinalis]